MTPAEAQEACDELCKVSLHTRDTPRAAPPVLARSGGASCTTIKQPVVVVGVVMLKTAHTLARCWFGGGWQRALA